MLFDAILSRCHFNSSHLVCRLILWDIEQQDWPIRVLQFRIGISVFDRVWSVIWQFLDCFKMRKNSTLTCTTTPSIKVAYGLKIGKRICRLHLSDQIPAALLRLPQHSEHRHCDILHVGMSPRSSLGRSVDVFQAAWPMQSWWITLARPPTAADFASMGPWSNLQSSTPYALTGVPSLCSNPTQTAELAEPSTILTWMFQESALATHKLHTCSVEDRRMKGIVRMLPLPVPLGTHIDANRFLQQHLINTKRK